MTVATRNWLPHVREVAEYLERKYSVIANTYANHGGEPEGEKVGIDLWVAPFNYDPGQGSDSWNLADRILTEVHDKWEEWGVRWAVYYDSIEYAPNQWKYYDWTKYGLGSPNQNTQRHTDHVHLQLSYSPKDDGTVKGKTAAEVIDGYFAANYQHYGPYEPVGKVIVEEATGKIDVALAAALVEKESGGRNIFGCDWGSKWAGRSPWCNEPVTRSRLDALIADIEAGYGSNGVGLTQLTYPPYIQQAEDEGGAHVPRNQCRVGFRLLRDLILKLGYTPGLAAYNAGEGNWQLGIENGYAGDLAYKHGLWKERLSGTVEPEEPEPEEPEPEPGYRVIIGSRKKPLRKKQAERIVKARRKYGQAARAREIKVARQTNPVRDETEKTWVYGEEPPTWAPEPQKSPQRAESHGPNTQGPQKQETALRPTRKVSAVAAAGAVTTITLYILNMYGIEPPPELGAAIATVVALVLGYLVREGQ